MEVTTVSPSAASPTEGDDLCETDVTSVAIHSVTLLICLCGLAGNGAVIGLLSLRSRNAGIFDLALVDFLFLLFAVPSALLILVEDVSCSPVMPLMYMNFVFQLSVFSSYWVLYQLSAGSSVRYMRNFFELCCCCDPPLRLLWVLIVIRYWAFFAVFTIMPSVTFLCPSHQQEHCRAALISVYIIILLLYAAPLLVSNAVDFIKAKWGSQQQQPKRHDIIIFVIVLLALIISLWNFLQQLGYMVVPSQVVFLLACINSSVKPFIYFLVGRCWRPCSMDSLQLSLQRVFEGQEIKTARKNDATRDTGV
ncbi:mas-related G-protein coupled receptor member H-like [Ammospiza caudacuta]|uniref:mas-related G-protein coupled receptor member H-like n=1 Tax=Ammospiza caudacuta TaxID=2857398 RepID=UPI0027395FA7|nr:mas-related G-protein coupled receptor member H-like [Ammospiza caudacuta]